MTAFDDVHCLPAPPDVVLAMYQDADYFRRRFTLAGHESVEVVDQQRDDERVRTTCRYRMRPDIQLPGLARRFVPADMPVAVESIDEWQLAQRRGRILIRILPIPQTRIEAELELLAGDDGGSLTRIQWQVHCDIPLVGGRLAALLADDIRIKSRKDLEVTREIVKDYR